MNLFLRNMDGLEDLEEGGVHEHSSCCSCMIIVVPSSKDLVNKFVPCWSTCALLVWAVFGSSLFLKQCKSESMFSQKAEIGHGPGEDPYEDGRLRFALEVSVCVFRLLGKFKVWFWKLRV